MPFPTTPPTSSLPFFDSEQIPLFVALRFGHFLLWPGVVAVHLPDAHRRLFRGSGLRIFGLYGIGVCEEYQSIPNSLCVDHQPHVLFFWCLLSGGQLAAIREGRV